MYAHVAIIFLVLNNIFINKACPVYSTVALNSLIQKDSLLTLNWGPHCTNLPTKIRIYSENPYLIETPALEEFEISPKVAKFGKIETKLAIGEIKFPQRWIYNNENSKYSSADENDSNCLNFYILSFNQTNHVTNFDCMKINPQWMSKTKELWLFPLKQLLIPGTHCSGCYMTITNARRKKLKDLEGTFHQRFNVWQQLVFGIRYLDFSVGYFRSFHETLDIKGRFWVFNGDREVLPIFPILEDIRKFVEISKEIVVLNFGNFSYGFHENSGAHEIFKQILQSTFGHIAVINQLNGKNSYDFTIQQLKSSSKHVIILYNHHNLSVYQEQKETILWSLWNHSEMKTDKNVVKNLSTELSTMYRLANKTDIGWILNINYGNSSMKKIEEINLQIVSLLNGPWGMKSNVVSLDFAFSTNIIETSLYVNQQKSLATQNFIVVDL